MCVRFLCVHVKELKRLREMSVLSDLKDEGRLQGNGGVHVRDAYSEGRS